MHLKFHRIDGKRPQIMAEPSPSPSPHGMVSFSRLCLPILPCSPSSHRRVLFLIDPVMGIGGGWSPAPPPDTIWGGLGGCGGGSTWVCADMGGFATWRNGCVGKYSGGQYLRSGIWYGVLCWKFYCVVSLCKWSVNITCECKLGEMCCLLWEIKYQWGEFSICFCFGFWWEKITCL